MACNASVERCAAIFAPVKRQASSNYGIGSDGRIGMYCEEKNRSWCTSSGANDHRAVTIEVANDSGGPNWHISDKALASLIDLCADICKRNGIKRLLWKNDKKLIGHTDQQNMTVHRWFASKYCPGPYLLGLHGYIADEVNRRLDGASGGGSQPATITYTVAKGESLSRIAADWRKKGVNITWQQIAALNGIKFPYIIRPGQKLRIK
jgi:nucleoid-associated protein YgaU